MLTYKIVAVYHMVTHILVIMKNSMYQQQVFILLKLGELKVVIVEVIMVEKVAIQLDKFS